MRSLESKFLNWYISTQGEVLLTGLQAIVRIAIDQARLNKHAGIKTGTDISGYQGSPLGGIDKDFHHAKDLLNDNNIFFRPGINDEIAATCYKSCGGHW